MRWFLIYYNNQIPIYHRYIIWNISAVIYYYFSCMEVEIMHMGNLTVVRRRNSRILSFVKLEEGLGKEWTVMIVLLSYPFIWRYIFNDSSMPGTVLGTGDTQLDKKKKPYSKRTYILLDDGWQ